MDQVKISVPIDHGNRHIKTINHVFPASYVESGHLPSFGGDVLNYYGKEYTLTDQRMPQKTDKTKDDSYFILTLFAISKELESDADILASAVNGTMIEVELLVGLPPMHCREMGERFTSYFKEHGEHVVFKFNQRSYAIMVKDVFVYPQAYSAVLTFKESLMDSQVINLVDVGGYTVDILQLVGLKPNMSVCTSLYAGVNTLFQRINDRVRAKGSQNIPDSIIEGMIQNNPHVVSGYSSERVELIRSCTEQFVKELLLDISQAGLDLVENRTVFVGGGSILLREYIEKTGLVATPFFVEDIKANAKGYQLLYENRKSTRAHNQ